MRFALPALVCITLITTCPAAQAAQRYASPGGTGETCSQAAPCSLKQALEKAKANDEVIITSGSYTLATPVSLSFAASNARVHGDLSGPMPTISGSFSAAAFAVDAAGSSLSYVDVANSGEGAIAIQCAREGQLDRVRATVTGKYGVGISQIQTCAVRDSVTRATGTMSAALSSSSQNSGDTGVARNVTAIASGSESVGVKATYTEFIVPGSYTLDLKNAIAQGDSADLLAAEALGPASTSTIVVSNSNFDVANATLMTKIVDAGANQTAGPLFVNAAADDYREAAGSPTIDAGSTDKIGALDFEGKPRTLGAAPDIGAFEFSPTPIAGQIQSLVVAPRSFRPANLGGSIISSAKKAPVGATLSYGLSATATVSFTVERKTAGRRAGRKCKPRTRRNAGAKKCTLFKPVKGGFTNTGVAGLNKFKFSGRLGNKELKPGSYRLVGSAGGAVKRASFRIVR